MAAIDNWQDTGSYILATLLRVAIILLVAYLIGATLFFSPWINRIADLLGG